MDSSQRKRKISNPTLTNRARQLRREMTPEELHLWLDFLKPLPLVVKRQKVIGYYIVDFCIPSKKIIIEVDGRQHGWEGYQERDAARSRFLSSLGYFILRYTNIEINNNFYGVCRDIQAYIEGKKTDSF